MLRLPRLHVGQRNGGISSSRKLSRQRYLISATRTSKADATHTAHVKSVTTAISLEEACPLSGPYSSRMRCRCTKLLMAGEAERDGGGVRRRSSSCRRSVRGRSNAIRARSRPCHAPYRSQSRWLQGWREHSSRPDGMIAMSDPSGFDTTKRPLLASRYLEAFSLLPAPALLFGEPDEWQVSVDRGSAPNGRHGVETCRASALPHDPVPHADGYDCPSPPDPLKTPPPPSARRRRPSRHPKNSARPGSPPTPLRSPHKPPPRSGCRSCCRWRF